MTDGLLGIIALVIFVAMVAGLGRAVRGPTAADRMLAVLLFGTSSVAMLVLLAPALDVPAAVDVALVFALLAAVAGVAFAMRTGRTGPPGIDSGSP